MLLEHVCTVKYCKIEFPAACYLCIIDKINNNYPFKSYSCARNHEILKVISSEITREIELCDLFHTFISRDFLRLVPESVFTEKLIPLER